MEINRHIRAAAREAAPARPRVPADRAGAMAQHLNLLTIGTADLARSRSFYVDGRPRIGPVDA